MPRPNLYLIVTILFWGFNFISLKFLFEDFTPPGLLFARYWFTWLCLIGLCVLQKKAWWPPKEDRGRLWFSGFLSMGLYMVLFFEGTNLTTPAEAAIILATSPIFTGLFSVLKGDEKLSKLRLVSALVSFVGVVLVILGRPLSVEGHLTGNLIVLLSSVTWAWSVVSLKPMLSKYTPVQAFTMAFGGAAPLVFLYGLGPFLKTPFQQIDIYNWGHFVQVVLGSGLIAFVSYYKGVEQLGTSRAVMYQFLVPPLTVGYAFWLRGERLAVMQFWGLAIILSALILGQQQQLASNLKRSLFGGQGEKAP